MTLRRTQKDIELDQATHALQGLIHDWGNQYPDLSADEWEYAIHTAYHQQVALWQKFKLQKQRKKEAKKEKKNG